MFLPANAFKLITAARDNVMDTKAPDFPKIELIDCGNFKYFKSGKLLVIVFPETSPGAKDGFIVYAFFKRDFSNFSTVKAIAIACDNKRRELLLNARLDCGEHYFKVAASVLFVDPETGKNLDVLQAVLDAKTPAEAKSAPYKLKDFNKALWDEASLGAMKAAQMYKVRDPIYRNRYLEVAQIARDNGVLPANVFFAEATEVTPAVPATETTKAKPEYPADAIWGTAVGVDRLFEVLKEGASPELRKYFEDPIATSKSDDCISIDGVRLGQNRLGVAMKEAFLAVTSDFDGLYETMEEFLESGDRMGFFDYFTYSEEPDAKRSRSEDLACTEEMPAALGRTLSGVGSA